LQCALAVESWHADHGELRHAIRLWDRRSSALIGQAQLKNLDWAVRRAELAYLLDRGAEDRV